MVAAITGRAAPASLPSPGEITPAGPGPGAAALAARVGRRADRAQARRLGQQGVRLVCPGDPEWPTQLDDLGDAAPCALWLRGPADLRYACLRSVSVVGSRAASAYGTHVGTELAAALAERGWTVISGGAYGIDGSAHRGRAGRRRADDRGPGQRRSATAYPRGPSRPVRCHRRPGRPGQRVAAGPHADQARLPGPQPGHRRAQPGHRRGRGRPAQRGAEHRPARPRPVPAGDGRAGPGDLRASAGCHEIIREWGAVCVTSAAQVLEHVSAVGDHRPERGHGPVLPHDALDPVTARVLEAVPARAGDGPAAIAVSAGVDLDTAIRCLGVLAAAGFVERCDTAGGCGPAGAADGTLRP